MTKFHEEGAQLIDHVLNQGLSLVGEQALIGTHPMTVSPGENNGAGIVGWPAIHFVGTSARVPPRSE